MAVCPAFDPAGPYVTGLTGFVDCQVQALGEDGYRALGLGSSFGLALTGMLTIYVALLGYRMLLGETLTLRGGGVAMVKIGFVLALAQQWPAYQALVYRVVIDGPSELANTVLAPSGLGGTDSQSLAQRVQAAYAALNPNDLPTTEAQNTNTAAANPAVPVPSGLGTPSITNATTERAGQVLVLSSLAGLLSVRIIAALLLALGPVFVTLLLFESTRGLFEGWVKGLAGAALGSIGVATTIVFELAVLEPQVALLLRARFDNLPAPLLPGEILATTLVFATILLIMVLAVARVAYGFRFVGAPQRIVIERGQTINERLGGAISLPTLSADSNFAERSRVHAIAEAAEMAARRDTRIGRDAVATTTRADRTSIAPSADRNPGAPVPLGQSYRRSAAVADTRSAARREARA